jgi:hypothetical protein
MRLGQGFRQACVITGQSSKAGSPVKAVRHDPAPGQQHKALFGGRQFHLSSHRLCCGYVAARPRPVLHRCSLDPRTRPTLPRLFSRRSCTIASKHPPQPAPDLPVNSLPRRQIIMQALFQRSRVHRPLYLRGIFFRGDRINNVRLNASHLFFAKP